ncbi:NHS-like protein 1 isoform X3 [Arapaima gigas]
MIAYVHCLSSEPALGCWHKAYYEDEEELLPLYTRRRMGNVQPKTEGSLRRRLLASKIHQKQDSLWAPRPLQGPEPKALMLSPGRLSCPVVHSHLDQKGELKVALVLESQDNGAGQSES